MKKWKRATVVVTSIAAIVGLLVTAGCGGGVTGRKTHDVYTPYDGSVFDVATAPSDGEDNIARDSWINVFWPEFPPPAEFTVRLEKEERPGEWGGVHTVLRHESQPENGDWWFAPTSLFSLNTWYRIIIRDVNTEETVTHFFYTGILLSRSESTKPSAETTAAKKYRPKGAEDAPLPSEEGAVEHTIRPRGGK